MHCGQTYLTASHSQLCYFCYFLISRRDGENNGFLAGVPLLPPPSRVVSRPNSLPLPFRTPAMQASRKVSHLTCILIKGTFPSMNQHPCTFSFSKVLYSGDYIGVNT